jgi:hypothetical protein
MNVFTSRFRFASYTCALLFSAFTATVLEAQAERPRVEAGAGVLRLSIGGYMQPRFEYSHADGTEDLSSFMLRRVRLDVQGTVLDERLTFRIMPELAGTATLRDGYIDFAFSPRQRVRFGQFSIPFQWHRDMSASRQHFAERGIAGEEFGFPNGRDMGIMLHGRNGDNTSKWQVGLFDGAGRNIARSNSSGNMVSGRLAHAVRGPLPREEGDLVASPQAQLSMGVGVQGATRSNVRAWTFGRADWLTGTADLQWRWQGYSLAADAYLRRIWPDDPSVDPYTGAAGMISVGKTLIPNRLDAVARWSSLSLDREVTETDSDEWGVGVNVYHMGHQSKTRIQYLSNRVSIPGGSRIGAGVFLVEYHIEF